VLAEYRQRCGAMLRSRRVDRNWGLCADDGTSRERPDETGERSNNRVTHARSPGESHK
jgi:hypothetical protein